MHLALIIYGSLDTISGGYLYDRMLVNHLRRCGDTVDVVSLPWRCYAARLAHNLSPALLRMNRYDVVLQDELNHPSLFIANRFAPRPRISIVHHLRSVEPRPAWQNRLYRFVERQYLSSVDGFIFNSRTTRGAVERLVGSRRPSVVACPAGDRFGPALDPARIRERVARAGPLKLLFLGSVIPRKGLHTLLDALAQIPEGWELSAVGSLTTDKKYAAQIQRCLTPRTRLRGSITDSLITNNYLQSDLLVVPSTYEGFGIVYLEGMCFGLPAIATTTGAAGEIITHGRDGFLIEPGDSAALARRIQTLIADRSLLLDMSLAARERFLRQPTWEQSMSTAREFLQKIVSH